MANHGQKDFSIITTADKDLGAFPQTVTPIPINYIEELAATYPPFVLTEASMQCTINHIAMDGGGGGMNNNFDGDRDKIFEAIETATHQLAQVNKQLEQLHILQQRARHLEEFIALGKILAGQAPGEEPHESSANTARTLPDAVSGERALDRKRTATDYARLALEDAKRPMRAAEMADYVQRLGLMKGQYVREVLRTAMRKHPDFERISEGLYALKAWPPELKSVPEQQTSSLFSPIMGKDEHAHLNLQQPLTACVVELLETARKSMSPVEIEVELARRGKSMGGDSVSSALSRLVRENRIKRPTTGQYAALSYENRA